ncbi:calcium-binding protein [Grimontia kaedaensis]|uniref:Calcium-binding protein n=1 Tax=Grimontia kaedaensis TaxID=2872157 RepID=A0ABY4WYA8_9GAMM|nr:calcium-binding protein [Grimontia kaedaensis]USH03970.1 calcium-binding protein [Grimontia kaedaensis]
MTTIYGIEFDYVKFGTEDDDTLNGDNGNGFINGFDGSDTMIGFGGGDLILGDNIPLEDYFDVDSQAFQDTVSTLYQSIQGKDFSGTTPSDVEYALTGIQDFLIENQNLLTLLATQGDDDTLIGGAGNDILCGGAGDDVVRGGTGQDILIGLAGDNVLLGGDGDDVIVGGIGNDRSFGDTGNDFLIGTSGSDLYFGGEGADYFIFTTLLDGAVSKDRIVDFEQGVDKVVLFNVANSFEDLKITQRGPTVELQIGEEHSIVLNNSQLDEFSSDDFMFYNS